MPSTMTIKSYQTSSFLTMLSNVETTAIQGWMQSGVVGNPSRGNLSRPRQISLGYLSQLVRFARKSVTTLGNLSWPRHISLGYLSPRRKYVIVCLAHTHVQLFDILKRHGRAMYERVVFYLENGSYPTGRLTKNSCHAVSTSVRLPILLTMLVI